MSTDESTTEGGTTTGEKTLAGDPAAEADGGPNQATVSRGVLGFRPPPPGMSRRDRRRWRALEVTRVQRDTITAARSTARHLAGRRTGWAPGFIQPPPRGLGRAGRRAWLRAERASTRRWWRTRRAADSDLPDRTGGALVLAIVTGIVVLATVLTRGGDTHHPAPTGPTPVSPAPVSPATVTDAAPTTFADPDVVTSDPVVDGLMPAGMVPDQPAAGLPPGLPPVAGRWNPTPITGVTAVTVTPTVAVDPTTVVVEQEPTGPVTARDQATPDAAVLAWLARTCPSSWTDRFGAEQARGRELMTTAGWTATDPGADPAATALWAGVVAARQTRVCGDLQVQASAGLPTGNGAAIVGYTAHRIVTAPGSPPVVEELSGARLLRQATDGRWFVDVPAVGG